MFSRVEGQPLPMNVVIAGGPLADDGNRQFLLALVTEIACSCPDIVVGTGGVVRNRRVTGIYADRIAAEAMANHVSVHKRLVTFLPTKRMTRYEYFDDLGRIEDVVGDRNARRKRMVEWGGLVLTVGGKKAVPELIALARVAGTPCLPLPFTGGASLPRWRTMRDDLVAIFSLSESEVDLLESPTLDRDIPQLVALCVRILTSVAHGATHGESVTADAPRPSRSRTARGGFRLMLALVSVGFTYLVAHYFYARSRADSNRTQRAIVADNRTVRDSLTSAIAQTRDEILDTLNVRRGSGPREGPGTEPGHLPQSVRLVKSREGDYVHNFRGAVPLPSRRRIVVDMPSSWPSGTLTVGFRPERSVLRAILHQTGLQPGEDRSAPMCTMSYEVNSCQVQLSQADSSLFYVELHSTDTHSGDCVFQLSLRYRPLRTAE